MQKELSNSTERQLLAHLLFDSELYPIYANELSTDLFAGHLERDIFSAYKSLIKNQYEPDAFTISELIKDKHPNAFIEISAIEEINTFNSNINNLTILLRQRYQIRELKNIGQQLIHLKENDKPQTYIDQLSNVVHKLNTTNEQRKIKEFDQQLNNLIEHIETQKDGELSGIATNIREYDQHTRGMQLQDLIILAAETSQGKTAFAISMIYSAILNNNPVLFISLEMSQIQLTARTMAQHTKTSSKTMLLNKIGDIQRTELKEKLQTAKNFPYYIDDSCGNQYQNIVNQIRRYVILKKIRIVVIDYLQLINNHRSGISKEQEVGDIARGLKNLAKELDIVIIAISQLSRNRDNPKPTLSRLRQSGQIEEAADIVVLLYRPEYYGYDYYDLHGTELLMTNAGICFIAKGRNIGVTEFPLSFNKSITQWLDYGVEDGEIVDQENENPF